MTITAPSSSTAASRTRGDQHSRMGALTIAAPPVVDEAEVLTPGAMHLVAELHRRFGPARTELLGQRPGRAAQIAAWAAASHGAVPPASEPARRTPPASAPGSWQVPPPPAGLARRRVELVAPATRAGSSAAWASGADVWVADLEDSLSPTWANLIGAHRTLAHYAGLLAAEPGPALMVRPRGLHLDEHRLLVDGEPVAATLVDLGLYWQHCAARLVRGGHGPYLYLPKVASAEEAYWWHAVLAHLERAMGLRHGTARASVLIETLPGMLEAEQILHALGEHADALTFGRWDYLFSVLTTLPEAGRVLPDRDQITLTTPFLRAATGHLATIAARRGARAIGALAAAVPPPPGPERDRALARVRAEKRRERAERFCGAWVAHPALVPLVREAFDGGAHPGAVASPGPAACSGQAGSAARPGEAGSAARLGAAGSATCQTESGAALLALHGAGAGTSLAGVRANIAGSLQYLARWLGGEGAVQVDGLVEDASMVEISRTQLWCWARDRRVLDEGFEVTATLIERLARTEADRLRVAGGRAVEHLDDALKLLLESATGEEFLEHVVAHGCAYYLRG